MMSESAYTAALLIIGNEILSGRTQDVNIQFLAKNLTERGIALAEVRVVPDVEEQIIKAVNELRSKASYVFTTGGIGPTHDDITAASIAKAFDVSLEDNSDAREMLESCYAGRGQEINGARAKMAQIPQGASLIPNNVSGAPGFIIENVYVLAGVPKIMQDMFGNIEDSLEGGTPVLSVEISCDFPESVLAPSLSDLEARFPGVEIGSYPHSEGGKWKANIVLRATDQALLDRACQDLREIIVKLGEGDFKPAP